MVVQTFLWLKKIDFRALKGGLNPGQFIVAVADKRNIHKMHHIWLRLAFKDFSEASVQAVGD